MSKFLILGAGPSGTACSIQLRKAAHEVVLVDRFDFPRHRPGETLHPGIEPLLKQLGVFEQVDKTAFLRHDGINVLKNGITTLQKYHDTEKWKGFQLYRTTFDQLLLNEAVRLGVKWFPNTSAVKVNKVDGNISSIQFINQTIEADYFIDATGSRAWLGGKLGMNYQTHSPKLIAYYGYVIGVLKNLSSPELGWDENGWTWMAQVTKDQIGWVRTNLKEVERLPKDWKPKKLNQFAAIGLRKAVDVTWRKAEKSAFSNVFLLGDAAYVMDPGTSHGVLKAIMSGIAVAYLIEKLEEKKITVIQNYYNDWMDQQFENDCEKMGELYHEYWMKEPIKI